jgi:sugar phosphate isomerase/epimerase
MPGAQPTMEPSHGLHALGEIALPSSHRREFLQTLGLSAAATALNGLVPEPAPAIEPIARTPGHHFKFSLAAYSYRELLGGKQPQLTLADFIDDCAKMGLDGTELTSYYFPNPVTPKFLRGIKGEAFRRGLDISGTAVGNDFCDPKGEKRDAQIAHVKRWIDYADLMDAPVIRIFSGNTKSGQSEAMARKLAIDAIEECCRYAGERGIFLALENHGGLTAAADGMLKLVRAVQSPWFGVNLDTGNFHSDDIYGDLAKLAPYAVNVQVKVVIKPAGGKTQPTDFSRLADILKTSGYRGYVVLEYEEKGDPREECPRFADELRKAFDG